MSLPSATMPGAAALMMPRCALMRCWRTSGTRATALTRAERRAAEQGAAVDVTEADQARRDRLDAAQSAKADDAVLIDATDLTLPAVIDTITRLARRAAPFACAGEANK